MWRNALHSSLFSIQYTSELIRYKLSQKTNVKTKHSQKITLAGRRSISHLQNPSVMLRRVRLCNQRSLEPVPDHPLVPVLVVPDEPDEPLLCIAIKTEFSHDLLDNGVLHSFPTILITSKFRV